MCTRVVALLKPFATGDNFEQRNVSSYKGFTVFAFSLQPVPNCGKYYLKFNKQWMMLNYPVEKTLLITGLLL